MRNGVRVEEDSSHITSQIIVNTSANTVYNNTLRVRGRESGDYKCIISSERHEATSIHEISSSKSINGMVIQVICIYIAIRIFSFIVAIKPLYLNATYKTPTRIFLQWTFSHAPVFIYSYVAYYQSGEEDYSVAFTIDSLEIDNRLKLTGLPVGGVHRVDLPSPVAGPVTPGECTYV